jgi:hypothetical protein
LEIFRKKIQNWAFSWKWMLFDFCFEHNGFSGLKNLQNIKPFFCSQQSPLASSSACVSEKMEKEGAGFYF